MEGMIAAASLAFAFSRGLRNILNHCRHTGAVEGRYEHVYRSQIPRTGSFVKVVATGRQTITLTGRTLNTRCTAS